MMNNKLQTCHDCGAKPGEPHDDGCDVERCSVCGRQRLQCDCVGHDKQFARWTGIWPGKAEADYLGIDLNEFDIKYSELFFARHDYQIEGCDALADMINDLTLSLSMWIGGYPFDEDHKCKQRDMIYRACVMIGKPNTMEELAKMCGFDEELIELARLHDKELKQ